jgi:hypothetical protein
MHYDMKLIPIFSIECLFYFQSTRTDDPTNDDPDYVKSVSYLGNDDDDGDDDDDDDTNDGGGGGSHRCCS